MEEILTDKTTFDETTIFQAIRETEKTIEKLNDGEVVEIKEDFDDYLKGLKKQAVKLDVCPACGGELKWNYKLNLKRDGLIGYVKCEKCDYTEVC
ncbi:MAG: hypothetical protein IJS93_03315 [Clostridia bacterium]|nr:hypothetical protein [Clostridia bacterium]